MIASRNRLGIHRICKSFCRNGKRSSVSSSSLGTMDPNGQSYAQIEMTRFPYRDTQMPTSRCPDAHVEMPRCPHRDAHMPTPGCPDAHI